MLDAARQKARRGDLRIAVPFGYTWHREVGLGLDPDLRMQEAIRLVFTQFQECGSARQVLLRMKAEGVHFPRPSDGKRMTALEWCPVRYRNIISVLKNPFYAGVYAYGKSEKRTAIVDGHPRRSYGHGKPLGSWEVMLQGHHQGYIDWTEFERNQVLLATNAFGKAGGAKAGRGGRALLAGLLTCARCGRRLAVNYVGNTPGHVVYRCNRPNLMLGLPTCISFGGTRIDASVATELIRAVEPIAVEAALQAGRMHMESKTERSRIIELELQQARYEAGLAERRYAVCDPDNRLIAAQLEKNWEAALRRVETCQARLDAGQKPDGATEVPNLAGFAADLSAAWSAPGTSRRARQRLVRTLITDIITDVDEAAREVVLVIHWKGSQHSQLRIKKPRTGEHGCQTPPDALAVMRSMAGRWNDEHIAASLNRMGLQTGHGKTWTAHRVGSLRRVHDIPACRSADKGGEWLTMSESATALGVTRHAIQRLTQHKILAAAELMPGAPYQIRASDLQADRVVDAVKPRASPCRIELQNELPMLQTLEKEGYNERNVAILRRARSAALFVRQTRPSSRNRLNVSSA